ncbi:MAG: aspartyl protease family protein [Thermoguttaceae bacterium]
MKHLARLATVVGMLVGWTPSFVPSNAAEPAATAPKTAVRESFTIDPDDLAVLVPVRVGDKDYRFMLDTGASGSTFDVSLRAQLGPRVGSVSVQDAFGRANDDLYSPPEARVGSLPLTKEPVLCHDLTLPREMSSPKVSGIVGMDFIKDWIVTIDFDEGRVDVLPPGTAKSPAWGESIPLAYKGGVIVIPAIVGKDVPALFEIDTGATSTGILEETLLKSLVDSHEARVIGQGTSACFSGKQAAQSSPLVLLSRLVVGPFRQENLMLIGGRLNILGMSYLSRYRITVDGPNERLYLAKRTQFAYRDAVRTCGLGLYFKAGGLEAEEVDEKGPAHAAGLRVNDRIVKLDGKLISNWRPAEIRRLLTTGDKAVRMTVERGQEPLEISLKPKR